MVTSALSPHTVAEAQEFAGPDVKLHPTLADSGLFGLAGEVAREVGKNTEADPAAVYITFLTYAGALMGKEVSVAIGDGSQPPRLFSAIVGASSRARKGTSFDPVRRIFEAAAKKKSSCAIQMSYGPCSTGEGLISAVRDPSEKKNSETGEPVDPGVTDKRLFIMEGELGSPLRAAQRDGNTLSATMRTAWDHGNLSPLTKNDKQKATGAHICITGHITNQELRELLRGTDIHNGFANRFIWICARRQRLEPLPTKMNDALVESFATRLAAAIETARDSAAPVELSDEAQELWLGVYGKLTADRPGTFGAVTARAEAQVVRLSLIFAKLDCSLKIQRRHLEAALSLWSYSLDSARFIFGDLEANQKGAKILDALAKGEKTQSELNKLFSGHASAVDIQQMLSDYQASGLVTQRKEGGGGPGKGRPKTLWSITPGFSCSVAEIEELEEELTSTPIEGSQ